ncbi:general negative regulator of transcription subunit 5 [Mortierella alpina]|uniref:General negative regulator of transcription subunit n=1 Tax=Mortierella alpina TaxID=64518 RepID=A0A9P6J0P2_MORAP|nr:general negative regulator of transcription subunit 5 [Mortierella alpina]
MATRKLQTEIDKVLKKVAEGVETFEETLEKIEISTNVNQKEKYESDLKKEIKKLQRLRDQIKTWAASNDIKDKRALMDNRKLIETQMEKFKAIEKEMKTKAYSREGLIMSGRMDPKEKEKAETCSWVTERVESLNIQIEALEAEVETLRVGAKRGKNNPAKERISELEEKIERHKWHQGRLELILRLLENGQIETDKVAAIQEDVNYYVDENLDPDFAEDEEIYTDLNLEEEEDFFTVGTEDHHSSGQKEDDQSEKSKDDTPDTPVKSKPRELESETIPSPSRNAATKPTPTKIAANLPAASESPRIANISASPSPSPSVASAVAHASPSTTTMAPSVSSASATAAASAAPVTPTTPAVFSPTVTPAAPSPAMPTIAASASTALATEERSHASSPAPSDATSSAIPPSAVPQPVEGSSAQKESQSPEQKPQREMASASQQLASTAETEIRLPAALADLAHSFETSKERALSKDIGFFASQMLEASFQFLPEQADTERPKNYAPKNPYPTPSYYPQAPPPNLFESSAVFEKFDIDTLFFIFYYQQGTYQQYLAARELKKQSWRFHKKYLTWFQRHEEPKAITDDYEQGTYIYFDYEGAWCQRKKTDFRFEYKFLEDAELV